MVRLPFFFLQQQTNYDVVFCFFNMLGMTEEKITGREHACKNHAVKPLPTCIPDFEIGNSFL